MSPSGAQLPAKQHVMSLIQMNRLDDAKYLCTQLCKQYPGDAELWFILGALCERLGLYIEAEKYCSKAARLQPGNAGAHYNHGIALHHLGKYDKAAQCFRKAIELKSDFAEAYSDLGNTWSAAGQTRRAIDAYKVAIRLKPDLVNAYIQLGIILQESGHADASLEYLHQALYVLARNATVSGINHATAKIYFHIGNAHFKLGSLEDAISSYQQSLHLNQHDVETHNNLGNALKSEGQLAAAINEYRNAIYIDPMYAPAYINLGIALRDMRQLDESLATLKKAVELDNKMAAGHHNLANVLQDLHRHTDAESSYRHTLQLAPAFAEAEVGLGNALLSQGKPHEAITHFHKAIRLNPEHAVAHSCLLFSLNYLPETSPGSIFKEHKKWGKTHAVFVSSFRHTNVREPDRKLRVGYVSPDFRSHSVAFFLESLLEQHNPDTVDVTCYSEVTYPDEVTERIKSLVNYWRNTAGKSDDDFTQMVREDSIDILIDLAGHTQGNRLQALGQKPAPVQISWLGYPNTTGVPAIDYRLTDAHADPIGLADTRHTEKLIRLPDCFLCYSPPNHCPEVGSLPRLSEDHITFGSFNMLAKTSEEVVAHWSSILNALPASRLVLKTRALQDSNVCVRYRDLFSKQGITSDRLELISWTPNIHDHLSVYNRVDIALDPYPYNGTTTSCEALWMGVPVITLEGSCHAGRVGTSLLHAIGLPELIASSPEEYRNIAVDLASNIERLQAIRSNLRTQVANSRLCDSSYHARNIENVYRELWKEWCDRQS